MNRLFFILLLIGLTETSFSQSGRIEGHIYDTKEMKYLDYAIVKILGTNRQTHTDTNGYFKIDSLAVGVYDIRIRYIGYNDTTITGLSISSAKLETHLEINLPPPCGFDGASKRCPVCKRKNNVIPIVYGLPGNGLLIKANEGKVRLGGCVITGCDPSWFCKKDEIEF